MKYLLIIFFIAISSVSFCQNGSNNNESPEDFFQAKYDKMVGTTFPEFSGVCDGKLFNNASLNGKTVYINFWVEACAPCLAEFEALNDMYHKLAGKKNFEFITFTYETPEKIREIKSKYRLTFKIISLSMGECFKLNQGIGYPAHFILNKDQAISYVSSGGSTDKVEARDFVLGELYERIVKNLDAGTQAN